MDNQYSFKQVARAASPGRNLPTLVFAFDSAELEPDTLHQWYAAVTVLNRVDSYPQVIYSLKRGALLLRPEREGQSYGHYAILGEEAEELKSKELSLFLQTFRKMLEKKAALESNPFVFVDLDGLSSSVQCVQFGKGLVSGAETIS